ncbi:MAG: aminopeptidase P family N-terminal domain-containing protein [Candidatus Bathyarchaeia archaeon]
MWIRHFKTCPLLGDSSEVPFAEAVISAFAEQGLDRGRVGLEFIIPTSRYLELKQQLPNVEFVDVSETMDNIMLIKDEGDSFDEKGLLRFQM